MTTQASEREAYEKEARCIIASCGLNTTTGPWEIGKIADYLSERDAKRVPSESEEVYKCVECGSEDCYLK